MCRVLKIKTKTERKVEALETDVTDVAEASAQTLHDSVSVAETLAIALSEIDALKTEIEALKGGN